MKTINVDVYSVKCTNDLWYVTVKYKDKYATFNFKKELPEELRLL